MAKLTLRQLNRATLARQLLLERENAPVTEAVERLAGLQAQDAKPPFIGLWSRLQGFRREDLHEALHGREVVRATLMRGTLHVMSAADYATLRMSLQASLRDAIRRIAPDEVDLDELMAAAREILDEKPLNMNELRPRLAEAFPGLDERGLGYAVRLQLPLVMVPTDKPWGFSPGARFTPAEAWLGKRVAKDEAPDKLALRYLAAFGPASPADAQAWSGVRAMNGTFERLRPKLAVFEDERGRELFDLPAAPRPGEDVAAPPRFLPEFDNLVLGHADRTRLIEDEHRGKVLTKNLRVRATFLLDGFVRGTWRVERKGKKATLRIEPFEPLKARASKALAKEGEALLQFAEPDASSFEVRID